MVFVGKVKFIVKSYLQVLLVVSNICKLLLGQFIVDLCRDLCLFSVSLCYYFLPPFSDGWAGLQLINLMIIISLVQSVVLFIFCSL